MEHIVQFAIGIDDDAIQKRIEEAGYKDVIDKLVEEAKKSLPKTGMYRNENIDWWRIVDKTFQKFAEEHKDEIIDAAAGKLVEKYVKTKAFKTKMEEVIDNDQA